MFISARKLIRSGMEFIDTLTPGHRLDIATSFRSYAERSLKVNKLILLERRSNEEIRRDFTRNLTLPFDTAINSSASVKISCPVHFSYYLDLTEAWEFHESNGILTVRTPPLRVSRPAVEPGQIKRGMERGWLIFGEDQALEQLEKELTTQLRLNAMRPENIASIIPECRASLENFIRSWLISSPRKIKTINIVFPGETSSDSRTKSTLEL